MKEKNPYHVLGVKEGASMEEVTKAYKKLVIANHPDKNPSNREVAEKKMKEINAAYESIKSGRYKANQYQTESNFGRGFSQSEPSFSFDFEGFDFRPKSTTNFFQNIFREFSFFGNTSSNNSGSANRNNTSNFSKNYSSNDNKNSNFSYENKEEMVKPDIIIEFEKTLKDSFSNLTVSVSYERHKYCEFCSGKQNHTICNTCNGLGERIINFGEHLARVSCSECSGTGKHDLKCAGCKNKGFSTSKHKMDVMIPKGWNKEDVVVKGSGNILKFKTGNLIIKVKIKDDLNIKIKGHDLIMVIHVDILTMLTGGLLQIQLFNEIIECKLDTCTQDRSQVIVENKGLFFEGTEKRGQLILDIHLEIPKSISPKLRESILEARKLLDKQALPKSGHLLV